ncbi:MAG: elongation factor Ts [Candidatus Magasanikbacteria bacterium]|nr:elongation factor Ts [Candidatus Magasanikbacteria bacterium]
MTISASDVMKLRNSTGAGMMDCKNALEEAGGDMDKAVDLLRKKGILKAAKRADKVAAEGLVASFISVDSKAGVLVEVNCETDFVGQSADFGAFAKSVAEVVAKENPVDVDALQNTKLGAGGTVGETANNLTLKIGEKISVRRFTRYESSVGKVYSYLHGSKIGVMIEMTGGDAELGTDVAMHVAASNPKALDRSGVDAALLASERDVYAAQLKAAGKPENIIENILKGKIDKFYSDVTLLEQAFIKNEDVKVGDLAKGKGATIVRFVRYELGEGIEKVTKDFVAEVAEQVNK